MNTRAPKTSREVAERLAALFDQVPPETPEDVDAELRAAGLSPADVGKRMKAAAEAALTRSPRDWRQRASGERQSALAKRRRVAELSGWTEAQLLGAIKRKKEKLGEAAVNFRSFEKHTVASLAGILADLEFLDDESESVT